MSVVAEFSVEYYQYLNAEGKATQELPAFARKKEHLIQLYQTMLLCRKFDAKAINLQRTGKLGTYPSSLGQEAVAAGMGHAMAQTDVMCPYYRDTALLMVRKVPLRAIFAHWGGDERGNQNYGYPEDFPIAIPVGSQPLHAAGVAYAFRLRKQKRAVLTSIGDGGTSEGDFYEAMNFAGTWKLPVVFVINNNQWAISVPLSKQTGAKTLAQKAIAAGFSGIQVDGNDVIAVQHFCAQALANARAGKGPTLIEAVTYRLSDHTTTDDALRYISREEIEEAKQYEPLLRLKKYLISEHDWTDQQQQQLEQKCDQWIEQAAKEYLQTPPQPVESIFDYLYAKLPQPLQAQRDYLRAQLRADQDA